MSEQTIILFFIILATGFTLFLYLWKAKKQIEYKGDERWQTIQNKANQTANCLNYALILLVAIGETVLLFYDSPITLTLSRVFIYIMLFVGLRNAIEFFALAYFDKQI